MLNLVLLNKVVYFCSLDKRELRSLTIIGCSIVTDSYNYLSMCIITRVTTEKL